MDMMGQLNY